MLARTANIIAGAMAIFKSSIRLFCCFCFRLNKYKAIVEEEVIKNMLKSITGFSLISVFVKNKTILIAIRIEANSTPILIEGFILAIHGNEEFLI